MTEDGRKMSRPEFLTMFAPFNILIGSLVPDLDPDAIVYMVEGGEAEDQNVVMHAARFEGGKFPEGEMLSEPIVKIVAREFMAALWGAVEKEIAA